MVTPPHLDGARGVKVSANANTAECHSASMANQPAGKTTEVGRELFRSFVPLKTHPRGEIDDKMTNLYQLLNQAGSSTSGPLAIVHFGSVGRFCGIFEEIKKYHPLM